MDLEIDTFLKTDLSNTHSLGLIIFMVGGVFLIFPLVGFYQALKEAGGLIHIALITSLMGITLLLIDGVVEMAIFGSFAKDYVNAEAGSKSALIVIARVLFTLDLWLSLVGFFLLNVIGVFFMGLSVLKTKVVSHWVGWFGIIVGSLNLLWPIAVASKILLLSYLTLFAIFLYWVWLLIMSVILFRQQ